MYLTYLQINSKLLFLQLGFECFYFEMRVNVEATFT